MDTYGRKVYFKELTNNKITHKLICCTTYSKTNEKTVIIINTKYNEHIPAVQDRDNKVLFQA